MLTQLNVPNQILQLLEQKQIKENNGHFFIELPLIFKIGLQDLTL